MIQRYMLTQGGDLLADGDGELAYYTDHEADKAAAVAELTRRVEGLLGVWDEEGRPADHYENGPTETAKFAIRACAADLRRALGDGAGG